MIDYLKENYLWIGAIVVPIVVALIGLVAKLVKKPGRKQKIGNISGSGNTVINGDMNSNVSLQFRTCTSEGVIPPKTFVARRGDEVIYVQVALQVTGEETYEREFGNLKLIKDNYPKYVVTMDPNVGLIHDSGIIACTARQFLLNLDI